jgi:hypothetical protein
MDVVMDVGPWIVADDRTPGQNIKSTLSTVFLRLLWRAHYGDNQSRLGYFPFSSFSRFSGYGLTIRDKRIGRFKCYRFGLKTTWGGIFVEIVQCELCYISDHWVYYVLGSISVGDEMNYVGRSWAQPGYQFMRCSLPTITMKDNCLPRFSIDAFRDCLMIDRFVSMDRCRLNGMRSASTENRDGIFFTNWGIWLTNCWRDQLWYVFATSVDLAWYWIYDLHPGKWVCRNSSSLHSDQTFNQYSSRYPTNLMPLSKSIHCSQIQYCSIRIVDHNAGYRHLRGVYRYIV